MDGISGLVSSSESKFLKYSAADQAVRRNPRQQTLQQLPLSRKYLEFAEE